jgi:hypothetical protein
MKIKLEMAEGVELPASIKNYVESGENGLFLETDNIQTTENVTRIESALAKERDIRKEAERVAKSFSGYDLTTIATMEDELKALKAGSVDSGKVDEMKTSLKEYYENKITKLTEDNTIKSKELEIELAEKKDFIRQSNMQKLVWDIAKDVARPEAREEIMNSLLKSYDYDEGTNQLTTKDGISTVAETCEKFFKEKSFFVKSSQGGDASSNTDTAPKAQKWSAMTMTQQSILLSNDRTKAVALASAEGIKF